MHLCDIFSESVQQFALSNRIGCEMRIDGRGKLPKFDENCGNP